MNDDTARLSIIWHVLSRRWRLLVVIAALGALVGAGSSLLFSPGYQTSASVLLQGTRNPDELLTEASVAKSSVVLDRTASALRWGDSGTDLADKVTAVVADGNIITVTATANTAERAQQLADRVAQEYVTFSTQLMSNSADASAQVTQEQQQTLRQQIIDTNQKISELHNAAGQGQTIDSVGVRTELESLRSALAQAVSKLDEMDSAGGTARMLVMGPAERPTGPAAPTMTHFIAGGAALFFLIGLFGHLFVARADKRLRTEADITSALGTTVLGGIDVPEVVEETEPEAKSLGKKLRGLVLDDRPWHVAALPPAADEAGLDIRYRRVVSRLREQLPSGPGSSLMVLATDDGAAKRAADRIASIADETRLTMRVCEVEPTRPTVPDDAVAGVLIVVTAGTRTGWELVGITEACTDAGQDVLGVVVTHLTRPADEEHPAQDQTEDSETEPALAGAR